MNTFKTHILAASNTFYEGDCESLIVPTADGQYGILAGHCDIISAVVPGIMTYRVPGGENQIAAVSAGLAERRAQVALPGGALTIEWRETDGHILMTGPATPVFEGEVRV